MTGFAAIALLVLVFTFVNLAHAAAQLLACRVLGIAPSRVSLGVGPTLWSRTAGETSYRLALLPVGIVVRLRPRWTRGAAGVWPPASARDLRGRSRWVRLAVFASGPAAILVAALASAYWMNGFARVTGSEEPVVGRVQEDGPAARAGIVAGDRIVAVAGKPIASWAELKTAVAALEADAVQLRVQRGADTLTLEVHPAFLPEAGRRAIGVFVAQVAQPPPGPLARAGAAVRTVKDTLALYAEAVRRSFSGERGTVGGPIALLQDGGDSPPDGREQRLALVVTLLLLQWLVASLTLPYLGGVRLLFLAIEAAARRPLHPRYEQWFNRGWVGVLVLLNVLAVAGRVAGGV